ncbi:MAG: CAP domain-containing protein [Rhodobacter sp.]|uniref:CAP domain-containing protein n=1 Tax=Pararhodobacter sp. TaxID=2127056 RepID=UPI001E06E63C|nr:CAP domain-containing protein [Pararhodobacter sp.]MCB1346194.1 CAP domain-containing protein [Paracoccaceae bacterium]MCB1405092.1 CAP domain-containing protein [Paracoccaceae bacterium]MCC0071660.1 CAP domain-containing protein [Rhodobacter sp.]HPD93486.1 CAP domain-containing protein [Pararhodobacter sp.]
MILRLLVLVLLLAGPAAACQMPADLPALRSALLSLVNDRRAEAGLPALTNDSRLGRAAQTQACRMADRERLTHRGSWLAGLGRRLRREDYAYAMAVENIGEGQRDPAEIVTAWMDSRDHRLNLLAPDARDAGFGVALAETGRLNWSMVAAAPR